MKRSELERLLRDNGCYYRQSGKRHDQWYSPKTGKVLIIPRHGAKELSQGVLIDILKNAGIKK